MKMCLIRRPLVSLDIFALLQSIAFHTLVILLLACQSSLSQSDVNLDNLPPKWAQMMYSGNYAPEVITKAYQLYYVQESFHKNTYTQDYKRFIRSTSRLAFDINSSVDIAYIRSAQKIYKDKLNKQYERNDIAAWEALGPFDVDLTSAAVGSTPGLAHMYTVEKANSTSSILVAGAATAGAWKSTDNGNSWYSITKDLLVTEVKAVEILSANTNTIFFGGNGSIYKSSNGGSTWKTTGSASFKSTYHQVLDIVSVPSDNDRIFAASNHGLYMSTDQGENWNLKSSGAFQEIEIHPSNSSIIYAVKREGNGTAFYRSTDGGSSFSPVGAGYPSVLGNEEQLRTEISVTPAAPNQVVALATGVANGGSGLYGVYVSDDMGANWTFKCCGSGPGGSPSSDNVNIMAWQSDGLASGGQYYYDLALAVSSSDPKEIYTGGINIWKSTDGGATFFNNADYVFKKAQQKYVHADIQDIRIYGEEIWVATDGGIFMSNDQGKSFAKKMYGIVGTDFRGFGAGAKDGEVLIGGTYHNGTLLKENNTYNGGWLSTHSGDNTQGSVNPQNNMITYSDIGIMVLPGNRHSAPTLSVPGIKPNSSYYTGQSSEYVFHPNNGQEYYIGSGGGIYKTTDNGSNFSLLRSFGSGKVTQIEIAPTNPDFMYVVYYPNFDSHKQLFKTTDGGGTWQNISPSTALFGNSKLWIAWDISVSGSDENVLWLARTPQKSANANIDGKQIFKSEDGGASWLNVSSSSMNGELITNIVHHKGTNGGIYAGTRRAVYYKNDNMSSWQLFQAGLPALTYSTNLVIMYEQNRIVNATHRGVYASALFEKVEASVAFQVDKSEGLCENETFQFSSQISGFTPNAQLQWTFENGNPSTSNEANPSVSFKGTGFHSVSLTVSESGKSKTHVQEDFVFIQDDCETNGLPGKAFYSHDNNYLIVPPISIETNEISFSTWVKRVGNTKDNAGIIMMQRFSNSTGLSFSSSGEVKYQWDESGTGHKTGLVVEREKWTHIAMTVSSDVIKVYVNGIERSFEGTYSPVTFDKNILLGKDATAYPYYLNGYFDEFCIFNETISIKEIRAQMNLVKYKANSPSLIHYFQFNDEGSLAKDIMGGRHASFSKSANYGISMAPIGKGSSQVKNIDDFGMHHFSDLGLDLNIDSGISCSSELGIYKIERYDPGSNDSHISDHVYIVNHFAEDQFFINGELTIHDPLQGIEAEFTSIDSFKLYQLDFDELPDWSTSNIEHAKAMDANKLIFEVTEDADMQGKFLVGYNQAQVSLAISDIYFELYENLPGQVEVNWFLNPEDHFVLTELQRSADGVHFETIESIKNERGKIRFQYLDMNPFDGINYYRVKMYHADQSSDFSRIDHINLGSIVQDQFLYPNPSRGAQRIMLKDINTLNSELSIYNMSGQRVKFFSSLSSNNFNIGNLGTGSYIVMVRNPNEFKKQLLVIN